MPTALITGAAGNLGQAVARRFHDDGYQVVGTLLPGEKMPDDLAGKVRTVVVDLLDEAATDKFITTIGSLDAAILTVGGFAMGALADSTWETVEKMINLNVRTAYHTVRPVFRIMKGQPAGGRLFLIGAKSALLHTSGNGALAYNLSKSLIFKLAELLNAEGAGHDVVAHVVVPSIIDTPQNRKSMPKADFSKWVKPLEIAAAIAYATSPEGRALREMVIKVYGGS